MVRARGAKRAQKNPSRMGATLILKNPKVKGEAQALGVPVRAAGNSPGGFPGLNNNKEVYSPGVTLVLSKLRTSRNSLLTSMGNRWMNTVSQSRGSIKGKKGLLQGLKASQAMNGTELQRSSGSLLLSGLRLTPKQNGRTMRMPTKRPPAETPCWPWS